MSIKQEISLSKQQDDNLTATSPIAVVEPGQWRWVLKDGKEPSLGCITHIGSNFVQISYPQIPDGSSSSQRIHFDQLEERTRFEPNPKAEITKKIQQYQGESLGLLDEIKAITASLGVNPDLRIQNSTGGRELAVMSQNSNAETYKLSLIKARKEDLPRLFDDLKRTNKEIARWMSAELLPFQVAADGLDKIVDQIEQRIFNVGLYAGLTEQVVQFADGEPAAYHEKLHIMQRMLFMDEECMSNYKTGGMSYSNIKEYDAWLALPENKARILPFPRCMVAMRVRRNKKDRAEDGTADTQRLNFHLGQTDMLTFVYLRNGEQLFRMDCDFEFEELIFPENASFGINEPIMAKIDYRRVRETMTVSEFEERKTNHEVNVGKHKKWMDEHPDAAFRDSPFHSDAQFNLKEWSPVDDSNVFFDECLEMIAKKMNYYNRVALIVQGLFDRSPVFHPHKPVKTWDANSFQESITLVYDASNVLHHGEAPDFAKYHAQCNASIGVGSIVTGQEEFWLLREGTKFSDRMENTYYRHKSNYRPTRYKPDGNEGPGFVSIVAEWNPRKKTAVFKWERESLTERRSRYFRPSRMLPASIEVPADALFNISAYKQGDFKQFFKDPRTRAQYIKWAPFFMAAEDYYNGQIQVQKLI